MTWRALATVLLLVLVGTGWTQEPLTREDAVARLQDRADVEARREGAVWLGETGRMADVPILLEALRDLDLVVRGLAELSIWQVWSRSGDPEIDALFQRGIEQMNEGAHEPAIKTFTEIIERKSEFAEGWNKRATVYYVAGEYEKSLADCEEVIKRNPSHFGALSGFGLNYLRLGHLERAIEYFERALAVNPNMDRVKATVEQLKRQLIKRRRESI